jgi:hypothetical protein
MTDQKRFRQGMRTLFIDAIRLIARLEFLTSDPFIVDKAKIFNGEIINLLVDYEANVAQYNELGQTRLERVLLGLEYIQHFNAIPATPLLEAIHSILKLKSELFSENTNNTENKNLSAGRVKNSSFNKNKPRNPKSEDQALLSENKKKILEFISQSTNVRPKDVLVQFSYLTKRTVKRNLQELTHIGLLHKENRNKAVLYTVVK